MKVKKKNNNCLSCRIQRGEFNGLDGSVISTGYFDVHQDVYIPISGFMIVASKRHMRSIDEFTKKEAQDFVTLLIKVRRGMRKVLGIRIIYLIQQENSLAHFHVWLLPVYPWMVKRFGKKVGMTVRAMEYARRYFMKQKNIKEVDRAVHKLQTYFK